VQSIPKTAVRREPGEEAATVSPWVRFCSAPRRVSAATYRRCIVRYVFVNLRKNRANDARDLNFSKVRPLENLRKRQICVLQNTTLTVSTAMLIPAAANHDSSFDCGAKHGPEASYSGNNRIRGFLENKGNPLSLFGKFGSALNVQNVRTAAATAGQRVDKLCWARIPMSPASARNE
jgi:hypothetical protein